MANAKTVEVSVEEYAEFLKFRRTKKKETVADLIEEVAGRFEWLEDALESAADYRRELRDAEREVAGERAEAKRTWEQVNATLRKMGKKPIVLSKRRQALLRG